jgi:peptide subunit release factor 1 (eRF1)
VGARDTLRALTMGQVEELLVSASPDVLERQKGSAAASPAPDPSTAPDVSVSLSGVDAETARLADELVTKAQQTGARITFIEDRSLLADVGGVGALLRFRL